MKHLQVCLIVCCWLWLCAGGPAQEADLYLRNISLRSRPGQTLAIAENQLFYWANGQPRRLVHEPETSNPVQACWLGPQELLEVSYDRVENIRYPDAPTFDQYDTQRRLRRVNLRNGQSQTFAAGRYDRRFGRFSDFYSANFSLDCRRLVLRNESDLEVVELPSLRRHSLDAFVQSLDALSDDGRWLTGALGYDDDFQPRLVNLDSGRQWALPGNLVLGRSHLAGLKWTKETWRWLHETEGPYALYRLPLGSDAAPEFWTPPEQLPNAQLTAVSPEARWALILSDDYRKNPTVRVLQLLDLQERRLMHLLPPEGSLNDQNSYLETVLAGFYEHKGRLWAWYLDNTRLLRWQLPSGAALPALESHAAYPLMKMKREPGGWLAIDRSATLYHLPDP
ncbi:MAG TPA: hypothetical protein V6D23_12010 [Candidatus Obscuribacterales bacterium]